MKKQQYTIEEQRLGGLLLIYIDLEDEFEVLFGVTDKGLYEHIAEMQKKYGLFENLLKDTSNYYKPRMKPKRKFLKNVKKIGLNQPKILEQTLSKATQEGYFTFLGQEKEAKWYSETGQTSKLIWKTPHKQRNIGLYQSFPEELIHM